MESTNSMETIAKIAEGEILYKTVPDYKETVLRFKPGEKRKFAIQGTVAIGLCSAASKAKKDGLTFRTWTDTDENMLVVERIS